MNSNIPFYPYVSVWISVWCFHDEEHGLRLTQLDVMILIQIVFYCLFIHISETDNNDIYFVKLSSGLQEWIYLIVHSISVCWIYRTTQAIFEFQSLKLDSNISFCPFYWYLLQLLFLVFTSFQQVDNIIDIAFLQFWF